MYLVWEGLGIAFFFVIKVPLCWGFSEMNFLCELGILQSWSLAVHLFPILFCMVRVNEVQLLVHHSSWITEILVQTLVFYVL